MAITGINAVHFHRPTGTWVLRTGGRSTDWTWPLFLSATVLVGAAPVLDAADGLHPIAALDGTVGHVVGVMVGVAGAGLVGLAQETAEQIGEFSNKSLTSAFVEAGCSRS